VGRKRNVKFGLFSTNSGDGKETSPALAWEEDLWEILRAEELGFEETWVAEHVGPKRATSMATADLFICKAAGLTARMRFGPAVRPLPIYHPIQVAREAAACDHLTGGRYMAGFGGAGGEAGRQYRQRGLSQDPSQSREMMHEAIDFILRCWEEEEPFDYHGEFWHGEEVYVVPKPLQQPRMPVGIAVTETISSSVLAGERGFLPLMHHLNTPTNIGALARVFEDATTEAERASARDNIRLCRYVYVSESGHARDEVRDDVSPLVDRHKREQPWQYKYCVPPGGTTEDVTFDHLVDIGVYHVGDPDTVYRELEEEYKQIGGFGYLLLTAGRPIGTREQRSRSWKLFMEEVAPRLEALGSGQPSVVGSRP
jgi:alkanesulfonate monooxygenase SsuD/methylene tetrahydromethanopterin reductase-like flavin-dependent oxidoreductase (luciferase family)